MTFKVGLLGLGTVGTGVAKILRDPAGRHPLLRDIEIARVAVRSLDRPREADIPSHLLTDRPEDLVRDPEIDIVVEVMGGIEPARTLILDAIARGKHVVTANKAVLARYGDEIFTAAKQKGTYVMLEAAVCGGIPVIQALKQSLGANRIQAVTGIINGTTNYILSRMHQSGEDFETILADAQALGYAEADPSADVDGGDAADKIAILASLAFGDRIKLSQVYREGIRHVTQTDITLAKELGYTIKLLAIARRSLCDGRMGLEVRVHPTLVPNDHPLASIHGVTNALTIEGDPIGEVVFAGPGAGGGATASAVVADLINVVSALRVNPTHLNLLMSCSHQHYAELHPIEQTSSRFYVRVKAKDLPGTIGEIGTCFGRHLVSLEAVLQKRSHEGVADVIAITQTVSELRFKNAIEDIRHIAALQSIPAILRVM